MKRLTITRIQTATTLLLLFLVHSVGLASPGKVLQVFTDPGGGVNDHFGFSVAVADTAIAIGSPAKSGGGAVFLFDSQSSVPLGTLSIPTGFTPGRFGHAIATTGSSLLVSAPGSMLGNASKGAAVFYNSADDASPDLILDPSDSSATGFGTAIAMGPAGRFAIAAPDHPTSTPAITGRVYLYSALVSPPMLLQTFENPSPGGAASRFGVSLCFSDDGHLAVGAPSPEVTVAAVYIHPPDHSPIITLQELRDFPISSKFGEYVLRYEGQLGVLVDYDYWWTISGQARLYDWSSGATTGAGATADNVGDHRRVAHVPGHTVVSSLSPSGYGYVYADIYNSWDDRQLRTSEIVDDLGYSMAIYGEDVLVGAPSFTAAELRATPKAYLLAGPNTPVPAPPNPPGNLQVFQTGHNDVTIRYSDNSYDELGFVMERRRETDYTPFVTQPPNQTEVHDHSLALGEFVCYRVKSYNEAGSSAYVSSCLWMSPFVGPDLVGSGNVLAVCKQTKKGTKCRLTGSVTVENIGDLPAGKSKLQLYLSDDLVVDPGDILLKSISMKKLPSGQVKTKRVRITSKSPVSGKYVILRVDEPNQIPERIEMNNEKVLTLLP